MTNRCQACGHECVGINPLDAARRLSELQVRIAELEAERPKIWEAASEMMADFYVHGKHRILFEDWEAEQKK